MIRILPMFLAALFTLAIAYAQPAVKPENKPYRVVASGKEVTIKSTKDIRAVMVWTAGGHRILEQKDINATSFTFSIGISGKVFFLLVELKGNERYTEKIGLRE
ncbi:MAG: hypothetical protein ABW019_10995 [Chitinophagaceae bacterium]